MAASNKSIKQTTAPSLNSTRRCLKSSLSNVSRTKSRNLASHRSFTSNIPKPSLNYPPMIKYPTATYHSNYYQKQQQNMRFFYIVKTPATSYQIASARLRRSSHSPLVLHQQPNFLTSSTLLRPYSQYRHFLASLRQQSLARVHRRQQEATGNKDSREIRAKFNLTKSISKQIQSTSNPSLGVFTSESASLSKTPIIPKRRPRPLSSYQQLSRSPSSIPSNYRLTLNQSPPLRQPSLSLQILKRRTLDARFLSLSPSSTIITPTNSLADETNKLSTVVVPYELELSGGMLNYCYISDSGIKYHGQLLSPPV